MRKECLKIRDDVDLKQLERFGFVYDKGIYVFRVEKYKYQYQELSVFMDRDILIYTYNGNITSDGENDVWDEIQNKLFDIISVGLVEKVVEDERQ